MHCLCLFDFNLHWFALLTWIYGTLNFVCWFRYLDRYFISKDSFHNSYFGNKIVSESETCLKYFLCRNCKLVIFHHFPLQLYNIVSILHTFIWFFIRVTVYTYFSKNVSVFCFSFLLCIKKTQCIIILCTYDFTLWSFSFFPHFITVFLVNLT